LRQASVLRRAKSAVAKRAGLIAFDLRFLALEAPGVAGGELARLGACSMRSCRLTSRWRVPVCAKALPPKKAAATA